QATARELAVVCSPVPRWPYHPPVPSRNGMMRPRPDCLVWSRAAPPAAAADVRIGDVSLRLPQFPGHCEMDPVAAADARLFASLHASLAKMGNRLLVLSADCSELRDWRTGKRLVLEHLAQYQTVIALQDGDQPDPPQVLVDCYCNSMLAQPSNRCRTQDLGRKIAWKLRRGS